MPSVTEDSARSVVGTQFTEQEFIQAFEGLTFPGEHFHHQEHIHLAWLYLQQGNTEEATARMAESIQRFATFHDAAGKFHATLTYAWVRLVAAALRRSPGLSFRWFLEANPELLDQRLPYAYYSKTLLDLPEAGAHRVEPDLAPMP